jgi:hypothetical protein
MLAKVTQVSDVAHVPLVCFLALMQYIRKEWGGM